MAETTTDGGAVLLVPMHLDALVINRQMTARGVYNRWRMDYSQMNEFENPMLPPFDDQKTDPPPVYGFREHRTAISWPRAANPSARSVRCCAVETWSGQ